MLGEWSKRGFWALGEYSSIFWLWSSPFECSGLWNSTFQPLPEYSGCFWLHMPREIVNDVVCCFVEQLASGRFSASMGAFPFGTRINGRLYDLGACSEYGKGYMVSFEGFSSLAESAKVLMWEICYLHVNAPINFGALHPGVA